MADGDAAVVHNLLEPSATMSASSYLDDHDEGFTFAAVPRLAGWCAFADGRVGPVYPVFGRPLSPPSQEEEGPRSATVRVPLGQLLLEERGSPSGHPDDGELDGVPAETYCLWSPGRSPAPAGPQSPARCRKSGSTGSVLRWRQRLLGRSHSDGKEKFVFLDASSERDAGGGHGWSRHGGGGAKGGAGGNGGRSPFLPQKQDLVGLFANAGAFRRSYHPF